MRKHLVNLAKKVVKTPFKVSGAILKHRRKIVGGAMASGVALAGLAKANPGAALKVLKTGAKGLHMASKAVQYVKR